MCVLGHAGLPLIPHMPQIPSQHTDRSAMQLPSLGLFGLMSQHDSLSQPQAVADTLPMAARAATAAKLLNTI